MAGGNDCPECGECIGVGAVFAASLPNRIWCPHCKSRLQYGGTSWLLGAAILLTIAVIVGTGTLAWWLGSESPVIAGVIWVGLLIVGLVLLEVAFVLLLWYGNYQLERVNSPPTYEDEDF